MSILVFDIETIPDLETGRKLHGLEGIDDENAERAMVHHQAQKTGSEFLPLYLQRIVAISVLYRSKKGEELTLRSLGDESCDEAEILKEFNHAIDKHVPQLVSWNGGGFDLPVIQYRSLLHGSIARQYWERGGNNQSFRYDNYLSRYHTRHTDMMDVLSGYNLRGAAPLNGIAQMLGLPGKLGMSGSEVSSAWQRGEYTAIQEYCEIDALNTYLIFLRLEWIQGRSTQDDYNQHCKRVRAMLQESEHKHWHEFLALWQDSFDGKTKP